MSRDARRMRKWNTVPGLLCAVLASAAVGAGCSSESDEKSGTTGTTGQCLSERDYFAKKVQAGVFGNTCQKCHAPGGQADEEGAEFTLLPPSYPGFIDANLAAAKQFAKTEFDGKSVLVRKPVGELEHGGGKAIDPSSPEYASLKEFISLVKSDDFCEGGSTVKGFDDVVLHDTLTTFRRSTLQLAGRLPNAVEIDRIITEGEASLQPLLDELMKEDAFFEWIKETFNDVLLTDRYLGYSSYAVSLLNDDQYPQSGDVWFENLDSTQKSPINKAVGREPLELIAYIVKNDRPFTEVLTADYTLMNPDSARIFNANIKFDDPNDPGEWKPGKIRPIVDGSPQELPHAGVLSSPIWLNRFPTTPTNVNRHRARKVLKFFLATDILRIAERPIDPLAATAYNNPPREDPGCNVCHRMMDPIAGAFQKFDDNDQEKYEPDNSWHQEMFPPGFGKETMPTTEYSQSLQWLAQRIVQDPRFSLSMVYTVYTTMTGQEPLIYPTSEDPDFDAKLIAWEAQDALFRKIGDAFVDSNFNLKTVIKGVILSPYFRAKNTVGEPSAARAVELSIIGTGRLSTPESLSRKIRAVTGLPWGKGSGYYKTDYLNSDYRVLYGGIDSDDVTVRLTAPNGVMANVAWRMANEVSCQTTAWDLSIDKPADRFLFPYVNVEDTPDTNADAIKKNIQYLHAHITGETLQLSDPEISATYNLFNETLKEGQAKIASDTLTESINYRCRARKDPYTDADLPDEQKLEKDPDYTVRAWMAVITYLLSDHGFLYE